MVGVLSSVCITHIACYWKFFLLHYIQVRSQYRLCRADHACLTYLMLQRQLSHLSDRKLDHSHMDRIENSSLNNQIQSYVTTDGQSASLSRNKAPIWGLRPDIYYLCDSYGLDLVGRPIWREVGSIFCNCYWSSPAQSFLGPSPVGLMAIFYCLRFETSLFVASYDSQGHGGGIRSRLHTGLSQQFFCYCVT
jgi:hypothetical protein